MFLMQRGKVEGIAGTTQISVGLFLTAHWPSGDIREGIMIHVRKEVTDLIRSSDLLLHTNVRSNPLTETEKELLEAYIMRLCDQLKLSIEPSQVEASDPLPWTDSQREGRHKANP